MTSVMNTSWTRALRRSVVRATLAPSVHNTQPWRFVLDDNVLEIHADPSRRLHVLDPQGRQMMLSCGCALFNARVALAASGCRVTVERFPDPASPDLIARIVAVSDGDPSDPALAALNPSIDRRQTNRREFADEAVPQSVVEALIESAHAEGAQAIAIERPEDRQATARLSQLADRIENADPAYRAELRAWTSEDPRRVDGVPASAVPHVDAGAEDDVPIRDFDTHGMGWLPIRTRSSLDQCMLLLGAVADNRMAWLRAGEGLERVLLEITRRGFAASPLTQVIEVAKTNALLRQELRLGMHPHVLLRVGRASATPATRRRRLVDVFSERA